MGTELPDAPGFRLPIAKLLSLSSLSDKHAIVLVFFDHRGSEFCMKRLTAFQAILPTLLAKNIHVLGISVDNDPAKMALWAEEIGVSFSMLCDMDGAVSASYGLLDKQKNSERAVVVIKGGKIIFRKTVVETEVPAEVLQLIH